ncbi:hypothetical protein HID58_061163, partial [Brassica napus]
WVHHQLPMKKKLTESHENEDEFMTHDSDQRGKRKQSGSADTMSSEVQVWVVLPLLNEVKAFKIGVRSVLGSEDQGHVCIDLMFPVILNGESYWDKYR